MLLTECETEVFRKALQNMLLCQPTLFLINWDSLFNCFVTMFLDIGPGKNWVKYLWFIVSIITSSHFTNCFKSYCGL